MQAATCPSDDALSAMVRRLLPPDEAELIGAHIDGCMQCQQVVVAAVRGGLAVPAIADGTPSFSNTAATTPPRSFIGSRFGRYELRGLLGAGGMGQVYDAYDADLDRAIALKIIRPELGGMTSPLAERLVRESRIMAKVVHPSVIAVHDVGRQDDAAFIAMELVRGETLAAYLARTKPGWREIVSLFEQAGEGLLAAHIAGVIHRDFKPENVLVELDGERAKRLVVTDFGIAQTVAIFDDLDTLPQGGVALADDRLTATGAAIGTPAYMAPEQLAAKPVDQRADVFAFCVSLWEALFGARPFAGKTIEELRASLRAPPRAPRTSAPRRLTRALERGLSIDPSGRPDMRSILRVLSAVRSRRRRIVLGLGGAGVMGITTAVTIAANHAAPIDPCAAGLAAIANVYTTHDTTELRQRIADKPALRDLPAKLDQLVGSWRVVHDATCHAERIPSQPPAVAACLDARRLEIAGYVDDILADNATEAISLLATIVDPSGCTAPPPGLVTARVPSDAALRRKVTAIRYQLFDVEAKAELGSDANLAARQDKLVVEAARLWPQLHAEALNVLGGVQLQAGENDKALATLAEATRIAEQAHRDDLVAGYWILKAQTAALGDESPERALEYARLAEVALDRIGRPGKEQLVLEYTMGIALTSAQRHQEAEAALKRATELARTYSPDDVVTMAQGLGFVLESMGRYRDAVAAYREALTKLPGTDYGAPGLELAIRQGLALNLAAIGQTDEAEQEARRAVTLGDERLPDSNSDRVGVHLLLAQVLAHNGKHQVALAEATSAIRQFAKLKGERSEPYGRGLEVIGQILVSLHRYHQADLTFRRACDILAFHAGDRSAPPTLCTLNHTDALAGLGLHSQALALIDEALPIAIQAYGEHHPQVGMAHARRGRVLVKLGRTAEGIAALERAVGVLDATQEEPGRSGWAMLELGRTLWINDPARGHALISDAAAKLRAGAPAWRSELSDAERWLASHPKPQTTLR
ncbi:MAG: tetratricopeptide repeat protein [Kofleriaceae bacterium]